jgi:hypothetical protein
MTTETLPNIYLCLWNLAVKEPVKVTLARELLVANNLKAERAADIPATTALRRAVDTFKTKETEAKCWTSQETSQTRAQIDELYEEDGKLRRRFLSQYELDDDDRPRHLSGKELDGFVVAFDQASEHYTGADLSKIIQNILTEDGLGTYSPRKGGAVYFVPVKPEATDLLERIERFCRAVSINFLTYSVPDTAAQREEIANAIAASYIDEIGQHAEAIAGYSADTKAGIVSNRRDALAATSAHMAKLASLMNGRRVELQNEIDGLAIKLMVVEREIAGRQAQEANIRQQEAESRRQGGGRRIVTAAVA